MNTKDIGLFPLFAWPLMRHILEDQQPSNQEILKIVQNEPLRDNQGNLIHTDIRVLDRPELASLNADILEHVNFYAKDVLAYRDIEIELTQSWINVAVPGQHHHLHRHTNSIISGTYYPFGVDNCPIVFHNPNMFQFVPNVDESNQNPVSMISKNCINVTPNSSELMLWLSPMIHSVKKNESENNRVSLSFNAMIRGYVGHAESLSGVQL
jgi:uncharacterized protein (TIGR02466 family)